MDGAECVGGMFVTNRGECVIITTGGNDCGGRLVVGLIRKKGKVEEGKEGSDH